MGENNFCIGDIVFAKLRGFSDWPGKISGKITKRTSDYYKVEFFGDGTWADIKSSEVMDYLKNKQKILSITTKKNDSLFCKAINEADLAIDEKKKVTMDGIKSSSEVITQTNFNKEDYGNTEDSVSEVELSLAEEIKNTIVQENEHLKQELHNLNIRKSTYVLELEDTIKQQEEDIINLTKYYTEREREIETKLRSVEGDLALHRKQSSELIFQAEHDKRYYDQELENIKAVKCISCKIYKEEIPKMIDTIKSLESASGILQEENKSLVDQIKNRDISKPVCLNCFPLLKNNNTRQDCINPMDTASNASFTTVKRCSKKAPKNKDLKTVKHSSQLNIFTPNFETENPFSSLENVNDTECQNDNEPSIRMNRFSKRKMLLCTDSHGRDVAWHINKTSKGLDAYSFIKPGGRAQEVLCTASIEEKKLEDNSCVVIACGTNDISRNEANSAIDTISNFVKSLKGKQVILIDIPLRYDLPTWSCVNSEIERTNGELLNLSRDVSYVTVVRASQAHRSLHTSHGLHLNQRGKKWLAGKICEAAENAELLLPPGCDQPPSPGTSLDNSVETVKILEKPTMKSPERGLVATTDQPLENSKDILTLQHP